MAEYMEINGIFDLSNSKLSYQEFEKMLLEFIEAKGIDFDGTLAPVDENGELVE